MTQNEHELNNPKNYTIIVNTREKVVNQHKLTYEDVVILAGYAITEDYNYTISYEVDEHKDKSLTVGNSVVLKEGMIFDVVRTIKS